MLSAPLAGTRRGALHRPFATGNIAGKQVMRWPQGPKTWVFFHGAIGTPFKNCPACGGKHRKDTCSKAKKQVIFDESTMPKPGKRKERLLQARKCQQSKRKRERGSGERREDVGHVFESGSPQGSAGLPPLEHKKNLKKITKRSHDPGARPQTGK